MPGKQLWKLNIQIYHHVASVAHNNLSMELSCFHYLSYKFCQCPYINLNTPYAMYIQLNACTVCFLQIIVQYLHLACLIVYGVICIELAVVVMSVIPTIAALWENCS